MVLEMTVRLGVDKPFQNVHSRLNFAGRKVDKAETRRHTNDKLCQYPISYENSFGLRGVEIPILLNLML